MNVEIFSAKFFLRMKKFRIERFPSSLGFMTTLSLDIFPQNKNIKGMYMVVRPLTLEWWLVAVATHIRVILNLVQLCLISLTKVWRAQTGSDNTENFLKIICRNYLINMCITCVSIITYNSTYMETILTHGLGEHYLL